MNPTRRLTAALAAAAATAVLLIGTAGSASAGPTDDGPTAAGYGAGWLARQQSPDGSQPGGFNTYLDTADTALALAAAGAGAAAFDDAVAYLVDGAADYVAAGGDDDPGGLGKLLMVAVVAGEDPNDFGGVDLEQLLLDTLGASEAGLFGSGSPAFDGAYRQSLALLGLAASGRAVADFGDAIDWLLDQQCDDGAWQAYRADTTAACGTGFSGPDSNSTSLAVQALAALGVDPDVDPSAWFVANQNDDGGYGYIPGSTSDANSTALALQALAALGDDDPAVEALAALLDFQLGCEAAEGDRGAFAYQPGEGGALEANTLATLQAVIAAAGATYPVEEGALSEDEPAVVCGEQVTTSSSTPTTTGGGVGGGDTSRSGTRTAIAATGPDDGSTGLAVAGVASLAIGLGLVALARRRPA